MDYIIGVAIGIAGLWAWQKWGHLITAKVKNTTGSAGGSNIKSENLDKK